MTANDSDLTRFLLDEASAITAAAYRQLPSQVEKALAYLERCKTSKSKLVVSGVGKSGIISRKIAATFSSVGLTAVYLNPVDALHGDLGIVNQHDVVLLLSNSGETRELIDILPHLHRRGACCIALVGNIQSTLARGSQVILDATVDREVCPLNLAPTASTAVAMAIGDALAAVWTERSGLSSHDFAVNHPAGSLGRKLTLTVGEIMIPATELTPLSPQATLPSIISQLTFGSLNRGAVGAAWVHADENYHELAGVVTDGDIRRALQKYSPSEWQDVTASQMATANPVTITAGELAHTALERMEANTQKPISILIVVDAVNHKQVVGLIRLHDLVQAGFSCRPLGR